MAANLLCNTPKPMTVTKGARPNACFVVRIGRWNVVQQDAQKR